MTSDPGGLQWRIFIKHFSRRLVQISLQIYLRFYSSPTDSASCNFNFPLKPTCYSDQHERGPRSIFANYATKTFPHAKYTSNDKKAKVCSTGEGAES